jgi:hypothetical protein
MTAHSDTAAEQPLGQPRADGDSPQPPRARLRRGRLPARAEETHRCMVLACTVEDTPAVDLDSGALVRLRVDWGERLDPPYAPYDVVDVTWADDPERDDQAQPEAATVSGLPAPIGSCGGRRVRRVLHGLVTPLSSRQPYLLGFPGTSAPYWEFDGMRSSVAVVAPSRGPMLYLRRQDDTVWARFGWSRTDNWLPVEDRYAVRTLHQSGRTRLAGKELAAALGFRPYLLVVTISRPREGHCYKTLAGLLPRP